MNDENIILIGDLDTQSAVERAAEKRIALYARQEIDKIINAYGVRI